MNDNEREEQIKAAGLDAPRLTPDDIAACVVKAQYHVFEGTCLTVCCITLRNGYTVTGESACASPENFNAAIGQEIAYAEALSKVWNLEGYLLKERLAD